ncbi:RagB/SusD family nutrient uptake outer membrane protein [uncultured Kriegella sp.]|uniref:RagB/SusD family nutrient uptake outer membrane protein n=1 Tax=uncultured Kriegella sp. TaxID=1798910 RepID=UPI0030D789CF|tara:strand:- start:123108 stop:124679 length:1572 start_codon:yes stop_codon:yes gene_type:complete
MKRYNNIKGILFFAAVAFLSGCSEGFDEGLDIEPTGAVSETTYWSTVEDAELAVNAVYAELDGTQMVMALDGVTDIGYHSYSNVPTFNDVRFGEIDPSNGTITGIWNRYYIGIRKANDVIANIDKVVGGDQDMIARITAEARFLRAYYYTQLSSLWCNVPLITEVLDINDQRPTNSKEEIVSYVIDELDDIINSNALPLSYSADDVGRVTQGAALTLKARVAIRNSNFTVARDAAKAVMDLNIYGLYPNYEELFQVVGQNSQEVIFDRQFTVGGNTYNAFGYSAASLGGGSGVEPMNGLFEKYEYTGPINPDDPFENIDPRWNYIVYYTGQPIGTDTYNSWPTSTTPDKTNSSEFATVNGYNLKKWVDYESFAANSNLGDINMILMRYADVLLMYAESKIELNEIDTSVYAAINAIRQRPTVDMPEITEGKSQAELREIVRDERARELAFEGLRLFDINRWQIGEVKAGLVQGMHYKNESGQWVILDYGRVATFNENRDYCWPVPQAEMDINDVITQNQGYTN